MDSACVHQQKTVIHELNEGMQMAKQLRLSLTSASSPEAREFLIHKILSSYDNALLVLNRGDPAGQPQAVAPPLRSLPESSISMDSPQSRDFEFDQPFTSQKVVSKKRKTCEDQVRICTGNGLEGSTDDGYSWRKYGQKDILGAKFPRSYYRCTYRNVQNCLATKQVQRTDEDPTVFEITYKGKHTCNHAAQSAPPSPPPPEKHEVNQTHHHQLPPPNSGEILLSNLRANLRVNTSDLGAAVPSFSFPSSPFGFMEDNQQLHLPNLFDDELLQGYSPPFISPATSESNYFRDSLEFPGDLGELDTNFEFNKSFF